MKKKIILLLMIMFVMTACSSSRLDVEGAKQTVDTFLSRYHLKDASCAEFLLGNGEDSFFSFDGISEYFASELKYEIKSVTTEDDMCIVKVDIENIDFKDSIEKSYEEAVNLYGEEYASLYIKDMFIDYIESNKMKRVQNTYEVVVRYINDEWKIEMDLNLSDALTGGMNTYIGSLKGGE